MTQPISTNRYNTETQNLSSPPSSPPSSPTASPNEYFITEYSPLIKDDRFKINKLVPLKKNCCKFAVYIILNIITVCLINLFIAWFPKMKLCLIYSVCPLSEATHVCIYGKDNTLTISEIERIPYGAVINFDEASSHQIIRELNININTNSLTKSLLLFKHKLYDYIYNENTNSFNGLKYFIKTTQDKFHQTFTTGLSSDEVSFLHSLYGECDIDIKIHSIWQILLTELTDPFYLFQLYSIILWYCNEYEAYSTVIVVMTIISLITSVCETRANLVQLHKMSKYSCDINLYRKDQSGALTPSKVDSTHLVPGDLFEIPEDGLSMPCDAVLVNGTVIINESMLTGESTPIVKTHMPSVEGVEFNTTEATSEKYFLYAGTKIVQKRALPNCKCLAVCYATSFKTIKGNLIQEILYPKSTEENFQRDSTKYIIFMSCLCVVGFAVSLKFLIVDAEYAAEDIVMKFLDLITTTVPPSLPACISVGITYALYRLKKQSIICIARERVNVSGKVNVICFDKTGTLTEDHLDIHGYVPVKVKKDKQFEFRNFSNDGNAYSLAVFDHYKTKVVNNAYHDKNKDIQQLYVECLACCHGITIVKDKLIGDPIDVKMFEGIGWTLQENTNNAAGNSVNNNEVEAAYDPLITSYVRPKEEVDLNVKLSKMDEGNENEDVVMKSHYEIGIVRRFDFSSKLQRMTTIVRNVNESYFKVFCKGSPEKIKDLCKKESIPEDFNDMLNSYTSKGYRVLAMATKSIKMNYTQSQQISREFVESNMIFLGLLIVHNKLKEVTPDTIKQLDDADIRMVMATGDNILTAISVSKECKLVQPNTIIYTCNIEKEDDDKDVLTWSKVDDYNNNKCGADDNNDNNTLTLNTKANDDDNSCDTSAFSDDYPAEEIKGNDNSIFINKTAISIEDDNTTFTADNNNNMHNNSINTDTNSDVSLNINNTNTSFSLDGKDNYAIALTGPTFERLHSLNAKYLKTRSPKLLPHHKTFRQILTNGIVFARMAPEHKALLVESFKHEHCTVLMCGDGANDCSALKSADVGVSLSPEEASIAAHFTSKIPDISCLLKLLREGKGSLATSIQTFKYMMLYSLIQFFVVTLLLIYGSYLSDFQFLTSDLFIIFPLAFFMAMTAPYPVLTHHYPISSLLTFPIIVSILVQTIIAFAFQLGGRMVLAETHEWYENTCNPEADDVEPCEDNSVYFLISHFQYLTCALAFSVSKPFRKGVYTNIGLMIYLVLVYFYSIWITINCDGWSLKLFTLHEFQDEKFKYYLFAVCCVNFVVAIVAEWGVMAGVRACWEKRTIKGYMKKVKEYIEDPEHKEEFAIVEYQRVLFANRRMLKEGKEKDEKKEKVKEKVVELVENDKEINVNDEGV